MTAPGQNDTPNEKTEVTEKASSGEIVRWLSRVFLASENTVSFCLSAAIICFVMLFITTEIFSRFIFNYSFLGIVDIVELCVVVLVFASLSGVQGDDAHIKMDLLADRLKGKRIGLVLLCINRLFLLVVALVFSYAGVMVALRSYQMNHLTNALFWPAWPAVMFIAVGFFLLSIRLGIQLKQYLASLQRY